MCHSYHSPFHDSRSSNFDFLANEFNFFVIKKGQIFVFRFKISVEVESRDYGGFCIYQTYMLAFRLQNLVQSITNNIIFYCFIFVKRYFETTFLGMAYYSKFMLPYFPFIVKYFNRGYGGVMSHYFYHDINKIEVTLMLF